MIEKIYEVSCDICGTCINHYIGNKPTIKELKDDGIIVKGNKVYCDTCGKVITKD